MLGAGDTPVNKRNKPPVLKEMTGRNIMQLKSFLVATFFKKVKKKQMY